MVGHPLMKTKQQELFCKHNLLHLHNFAHKLLLFFGISPIFLLLIYRLSTAFDTVEKMGFYSSSLSSLGTIPRTSCSICLTKSGVIRANSNVISPQGFKKHTTTLAEHDLSYPIDYREEQEAEKVKLQLHATNVVTEGLKLKLEKQCADLAQDQSKYPNENKVTDDNK